jgi:hypothetical protein
MLRGERERDKASQVRPPKPAFSSATGGTVETGAPVHATPVSYGNGFTTFQTSDELAFAVDNTSGVTSPGITAGASTTAPSDTLFVLDSLYNASTGGPTAGSPRVIYAGAPGAGGGTGKSGNFGLSSLVFSFNPSAVELFGLDTAANLYCYSTPESPTGTLPAALTSCPSWSNSGVNGSGGSAVTWSSPYPIFNDNGDITRIYYTDDSGDLGCVNATTGQKCYSATASTGSGAKGAAPSVYELASPGTDAGLAQGTYVIYFGDENCSFWEVEDTSGTLGTFNAWCLSTNKTGACAAGTGTATSACAVHSAPVIDFNTDSVYVAANKKLWRFPVPPANVLPTWKPSSTAALASAGQINATPTFDDASDFIYVTTGNTLYSVLFSGSSGALSTVSSVPLFKKPIAATTVNSLTGSIAAANWPLGEPFAYNGDVFVNTGFAAAAVPAGNVAAGGASGVLEEYSEGASPAFQQFTSTSAGFEVESGIVLDWSGGSFYYGFDGTGNEVGNPGGGIAQVAIPAQGSSIGATSGWACSIPYVAGSSCTFTSAGTAGAPCRYAADCTATGAICANLGNSPAFTCVDSVTCGQASARGRCKAAGSAGTTCDETITDPDYGTCVATLACGGCTAGTVCDETGDAKNNTCVACDSTNSSECTGSTPACDSTSANSTGKLDTCQQCSSTDTAACTGSTAVCDTNGSSADLDTCVQCATGSTAACTGSTAVCDTNASSTKLDKCVQCAAGSTAACTGSTAVCETTSTSAFFDTCVQCNASNDAACTGGQTCDTTTDTCQSCSPANGETNASCPSAFPLCVEFDGTSECGQCTEAGEMTQCPSGQCESDGHCGCFANSACPTGSTCSSATSFGQCN